MKKLALLLAVVMVFTLGFTACGSKSADAGKQLVIELGPNPETLDPALNSAVDGGNYLLFAFDCLLNVDQDGKIVPGAAESWEASDDGLTWTFHLRKGLKWSDGSALTAADYEYSWKRVADPNTAAPYGETVLGMVKGYDEAMAGNLDALAVKATDDTTFVVELSSPCVFFDKLAAFATLSPVNKASVEKNGEAWATSPDTYVCNGPFYISEWVPDSHITFSKNPNYWNASAVKLDSIKCLLMEDPNASYSAYQTGEAKMIKDVPTEEIPSLDGNEEFHIDPLLGTYYLSINLTEDQFKDSKVRQAMSLAIDRNYVAETLMQGTYSAASNFIGTGVLDWDGSAFMDNANGGKPYIDNSNFDANLEQAKKLMEEAGYPNGEGFPTITYTTNDAGYHKAIAEYLQQAWKEIGITLEVNIVEWSSFTPMRRAQEYDTARNGWVFDYNDPSNMLDLLYSTNGNNDGKYSNKDFDAAMDKARSETDPETRSGYLHEAEDVLMQDAACIPLAYYNDFYLCSKDITGWWHSPYGYWYFQYADIA